MLYVIRSMSHVGAALGPHHESSVLSDPTPETLSARGGSSKRWGPGRCSPREILATRLPLTRIGPTADSRTVLRIYATRHPGSRNSGFSSLSGGNSPLKIKNRLESNPLTSPIYYFVNWACSFTCASRGKPCPWTRDSHIELFSFLQMLEKRDCNVALQRASSPGPSTACPACFEKLRPSTSSSR